MQDIDMKIYRAIEKLFTIYRSHIWDIAQEEGLSPIMIQFMVYIGNHRPELNTVSMLSKEFSLTKPTISDAIDVLEKKGYISKEKSSKDSRYRYLFLTKKGEDIIDRIQSYEGWFYKAMNRFDIEKRQDVYVFLLELLRILRIEKHTEILNSCVICNNFIKDKYPESKKPHYCNLLKMRFGIKDIRLDCPSNDPIEENRLKNMRLLFSKSV